MMALNPNAQRRCSRVCSVTRRRIVKTEPKPELVDLPFYVLGVSRWTGQLEKARKYNVMTLTIGTAIKRLNHPEYPALVKMNQNGMTISATNINIMIGPTAHICIGMSRIVSDLR